MKKREFIPKYQDLTFQSRAEFTKWLMNTTFKQINFVVYQQDLTRMLIDGDGEILHCDFHASIYNAKFVNLESLKKGIPVEIYEDGAFVSKNGLVIKSIIDF